jgi:hypothetical protein
MIKDFEKTVTHGDLCKLLGIDPHKILVELYIDEVGENFWNINGKMCDTNEEASEVILG